MEENRTIHLTKKEFDNLMKEKYDEGYKIGEGKGYWQGYNERRKEDAL